MAFWAAFQYRDFHDVPRQIVVRHGDRAFLLDCRFDATRDEYGEEYEVFEFPDLPPDLMRANPDLRSLAKRLIGRVAVRAVRFDATLRNEIDLTSVPPVLEAG